MTALLSPQVVFTVGSQRILTLRQMLRGRTAETMLPESCQIMITHNTNLYVLLEPRIARRYMIKEQRAIVVLIVTIGISMAVFFNTASISLRGRVSRFLPKPWLTDKVKNTVATIARS